MRLQPSGQADRLRTVPLEAVLPLCGGTPDRHDPCKWHTPAGVLSISGPKFMNWSRGRGGGGAIDLVIHLRDCGFVAAVDWLARHFAGCGLLTPPQAPTRPPLRLPAPDPEKLERVQAYLAGQRAIPTTVVAALTASRDLYADARGNAVFLLRGPDRTAVGAELRGTGECTWRGMAPGSRKEHGFFAVGPTAASTLVLCESAIDAISCSALRPECRAVSTAGARPDPPWLRALLTRYPEPCCGFDADSTGDLMADQLIALHPGVKRLRPPLHDWNDLLRAAS